MRGAEHENPTRGVVNRDCQVHGIDNLYIAGSSVFPTGLRMRSQPPHSGWARCGSWDKRDMGSHGSHSVRAYFC